MDSYTIKDLENLSGIKAHTIRIWEQRYNFLKPCRTCTNIRYYSNDELKKILNIALLNKYGYKISHIDKMDESELKEKLLTLSQCEAQHEKIVNELVQCMVDVDMQTFENALDKYISAKGIEKAMMQVIFPFLEKTGILWLTNNINQAQERLVSNIIRRKIIFGTESISSPAKINKKVLLFLPEGEHHELGILFVNYLLKKRGIPTIYLGSNTSFEDVLYLVKLKKPDYIYCHLTSACQNFNFDEFISLAAQKIPEVPFVISGKLADCHHRSILNSIHLNNSLAEITEFVSSIQ